ncbi:MAG: ABC transporter substrate-binding protein [Paracoccus sp. (in: a-proteobacteria)]|uniref:ABC transporter substrate-binding protein n=1 Tax=Paracoccus sp. TaxID=267 RepID=UPI0039E26D53
MTTGLRPGRRQVMLGAAASLLAAPALPAAEPLVFDHAYGRTVLPRPARRIVSLGGNTHDMLFALGIAPLALRWWWGPYPSGIWPWAEPYSGGARPVVIMGEVSMEIVAGLMPDLILGAGSGISREEYVLLSQIAPVVMQDARYSMYGSPWQVEARTIGRATGLDAQAEALIAGVEGRFAAARARHPDWAGKTAVAAWQGGGETGAFTHEDARARFLASLGFVPPPDIETRSYVDGFYTTFSPEDLSPIDADLLVWISSIEFAPDIIRLPMRQTLRALREGREVFCDQLLAGAMSFSSVLSLPFALERLEPELTLALDGDPATVVPSAREAGLVP